VVRRPGVLSFLIFIGSCLAAVSLLAGPTATLTGRVTNLSEEVIAGVKIEARNVETNVVYTGETNDEGLYNIPNLPPGMYRLVVQKFAYKTFVKADVELHVQDVIALNFSMELGSMEHSVTMHPGAPLIQADAQRGGNFLSREASSLPLVTLSPISLARTLPGVLEPAGSALYTTLASDQATQFSVNGARTRANNYLLDSTENNDIVYTGVAQPFDIADAIEEVSVQTGTFGVEFGRAGGAVFNVITKSGTNSLNGTALWRYQSDRFNSVSNFDKLNGTPRSAVNWNVFGFTVGGPIRTNKAFFFVAFQQNTFRSRRFTLVVPTEAAVSILRSKFPSNRRLDMYLDLLGPLRGVANPVPVQLGKDLTTGVDRGVVQFASVSPDLRESYAGPQGIVRLDFNRSEGHRLAFRHIYDSRTDSPRFVYFPGFYLSQPARNQNFLFSDQITLSPTLSNEFRFSYGRQDADNNRISPESVPAASTLPRINIAGSTINAPGVESDRLRSRKVKNLLFQETLTTLRGRHALRYGLEFLGQLAIETPTARLLGMLNYVDAPEAGYSGFANYLDDFSGPGASAQKDFSTVAFHPNSFRQTYFFQDAWLAAPSLSLTLGMRYENFGQPANALRFPVFSGFDAESFLKPNRVKRDNNNFGPAFGLAWSPSFSSGWRHKLFGENKTVWRGGYQITYDILFHQALSLLLATATPNGTSWALTAQNTGRGMANWFDVLPSVAPHPSASDPQIGVLEKDLPNPYTERWSFGFQRQLSNRLVLDGSYVGSESHKLAMWDQRNPIQSNGQRLHAEFGSREIRASEGNASYHAMQWRLDRHFAQNFMVSASYTWSRNIDSSSEGIGRMNSQYNNQNLTSVPVAQGGLKLDRGPSDYDRTHRFTILYVWSVPGSVKHWKYLLGGWSIAGITSFQSGAPFTVVSTRRNGSGPGDRPDIGNPTAPLNSRAIFSGNCTTGYSNPDTGSCVVPSEVHWIQGNGAPNSATVGRNTLRTGAINNFDMSLSKLFPVTEQKRVEFRWEAFNVLNHPQFTQVPARDVNNTMSGRFLNRDFTDSGTRSMWMQVKLLF
jgi:Carboxypeptidase regulatory-like domain